MIYFCRKPIAHSILSQTDSFPVIKELLAEFKVILSSQRMVVMKQLVYSVCPG